MKGPDEDIHPRGNEPTRIGLTWLLLLASLFLCIFWLSSWSDQWWLPFLKESEPYIPWVKLAPGEELEWHHWGQVLNYYLAVCALGWAVFWMSYQFQQPRWVFGFGLGLLMLLIELGIYLIFTGHLMAATASTIGAAVILGMAAYVLIRRSRRLAVPLPVVEFNDLATRLEVDAGQVHEIDQLSTNNRVKSAALSQFCADIEQQVNRLAALLAQQSRPQPEHYAIANKLQEIGAQVQSLSPLPKNALSNLHFSLEASIAALPDPHRAALLVDGPLYLLVEPLLVKAIFDVGMEIAFWGANEVVDWQVFLTVVHTTNGQMLAIKHNNPHINQTITDARLATMEAFLTFYPQLFIWTQYKDDYKELKFIIETVTSAS